MCFVCGVQCSDVVLFLPREYCVDGYVRCAGPAVLAEGAVNVTP